MDSVQVISTGIGHHGSGATAPSWTSATANVGFIIEVGRGIGNVRKMRIASTVDLKLKLAS